MQIHNIFSDILISVRTLFDNFIFNAPNYIKSYEFSIGSRSFQLRRNYENNFELPAVIVSLGQESYPFDVRETTVKFHTSPSNILQTPVLYDKTNNSSLLIQEEHSIVPIDITINCESQLHAKEVEMQIKRFLPLDKYIQFLRFSSFIEIDQEFLSKNLFDINSHEILNLFSKFNRNLDRIDYCYSINYKPLLKLDSIALNITDSSQRSFQVMSTISYMMQMPEYIFSDKLKIIDRINIDYNRFGLDPIVDYPLQKIINQTTYTQNQSDPLYNKTLRRNYLLYDTNPEQIIVSNETNKVYIKIVLGNLDNIILSNEQTTMFKIIDPNSKVHETDFTYTIDPVTNQVLFLFDKNIYDKDFANLSLNKPAIIQIYQ